MANVRYIDKAYPLFICLNEEKFKEKFYKQIKESKDFVAYMPKEAFEKGKHYQEMYEREKIEFALLYATEEGVVEMGEYLSNCGFGNYMKIAPDFTIKLKQTMPVYADYKNDPSYKQWLVNKGQDYVDTIKLDVPSYNKIYDTINPLVEDKRVLMSDLIDDKLFPFPTFTMLIGQEEANIKTNFAYQKETKRLYVEQYYTRTKERVLKCYHDIGEPLDDIKKLEFDTQVIYKGDRLSDTIYYSDGSVFGDGENSYLTNTLWQFLYINYFVRVLPTCYVKRPRKENVTYQVGKGVNKTYKNRVVLKTDYEISLAHYSIKHIRHEFKCLCWGVRGHYRHLQNGKVVFVQAYRKGKERNNLNAFKEKDYVISKKKEEE